MNIPLAAGVVAVVVGASVSCGVAKIPDGLSEIRVCTESAFDQGDKECRKDERGAPLVADRFYCSARAGDRGGKRLRGSWSLSGEQVGTVLKNLPEGFSGRVFVYFSDLRVAGATLKGPLLGGRWRCVLSIEGEKLSADFESGGPRNVVVETRVCAARAGARACRRDESGRALPGGGVTCEGIVAGPKGQARVDLLYRGRKVESLDAGRAPDRPVVPLYANFKGPGGGSLPRGPYACRLVLDGRVASVKQFAVG